MLDGEKLSPRHRPSRVGGRLIVLIPAVATVLFAAASGVCASDDVNPFPAFQVPDTPPPSEKLPVKPKALPTPAPVPAPQAALPVSVQQIPIGLDTVLRLAEQQNAQIAIARAKVDEAFADQNVAKYKWLPDLYVGTAYYRHEGGIQNEDGTLTKSSTGAMFAGLEMNAHLDVREVAYLQVNAQRQVWQQRGQLSQVTSETLLDASSTYIDLLATRSGQAVAQDLGDKLRDLLERAQKLASTEPAARVQVARIQAELDSLRQSLAKLRSQSTGAQSKLLYLLALDPAAELVPVDNRLVPFDLADVSQPVGALVSQAQSNGPGVREIQGILRLIDSSIARSQGMAKYLPQFEMRLDEGAFGAGANDNMNWDNRLDLRLEGRWNLTEFMTAKERKHAAQAKANQANLTYQDLLGKLAAGVEEARGTILEGQEQIKLGAEQIHDATTAYDLSYLRLREAFQSTSYTESLLALQSLAKAKTSYIQAISAYDKAQLRLMVLLGPDACHPPTASH
jgi:outer membrane protein TolC